MKPYDFSNPEKYSKDQIRGLEAIASTFARTATNRLTSLMQLPVEVEAASTGEMSCSEFFGSRSELASVTLFGAEPLMGRGMLWLDSRMALAFIDRMLGGHGHALEGARDLTEIENDVIGSTVGQVLECLADAWTPAAELNFAVDRVISSKTWSEVVSPETRVMTSILDAKFGSVAAPLRIAIPTTTLDPILSQLGSAQRFAVAAPGVNKPFGERIEQSLSRTDLPVRVELGSAQVTLRDLLDLQVGDLIRLDHKTGSDLDTWVGARVKFRGRPGQVGRRLGVKITHVLDDEDG